MNHALIYSAGRWIRGQCASEWVTRCYMMLLDRGRAESCHARTASA